MQLQRYCGAGGFSLIEVLISLAILGFGLLAVAKLQVTLLTGVDHARQVTQAVNIGQDMIEKLRSFSAIDTGAGINYVDIDSTLCADPDPETGASADFGLACSITSENNYKTITVTVSWRDQTDETREINLTSQISRSDPATSGKLMLADGTEHFTWPPP